MASRLNACVQRIAQSHDYSKWTIVTQDPRVRAMARGRNDALVEAFSEVLREARTAAGLTQEQLAFAADVDRTFIWLLESGRRQPTISVLFAVAKGVGLEPETLVRRTRGRLG